jgi:uncharacterized membrane protein YfhO
LGFGKKRICRRSGRPRNLRIATFYYPYWKAEINGQAAEVQKDENGVIKIQLSGEKSKVRLYFQEPYINRIALWLSLLSWSILLIAIITVYRDNKKHLQQVNVHSNNDH